MRKFFVLFAFLFLFFPIKANAEISAESAVVIDARNGYVLYEKNADEKLSMASTTKIMTALITLEQAALCDEVVEITDEMVRVEGSSMGLLPGYKLKLSDLAVGMLLPSGNDAANSAAIALSGSIENFANVMNAKAREFGMENTNFVTPSGLDSEEHFSTAKDMAVLSMFALKNEKFSEIVSCSNLKVDFISPEISAYYQNHNKLLRLFDGCIGVKTGYTKKSGRCLVSAAERNGVKLIAVTLNAPDDWNDHAFLLENAFSKFETRSFDEEDFEVSVVGSEKQKISAKTSSFELALAQGEEITKDVYLPNFLYAPIEKGEIIGKVVYKSNGFEIFETEIYADEYCSFLETEEKTTFKSKIEKFIKGILK